MERDKQIVVKPPDGLEEIYDWPRSLQAFFFTAAKPENWGKSISEICKLAGTSKATFERDLTIPGSARFWRMLGEFVFGQWWAKFGKISEVLINKADQGNLRAIEIYLRGLGIAQNNMNVNMKVEQEENRAILDARRRAFEFEQRYGEPPKAIDGEVIDG